MKKETEEIIDEERYILTPKAIAMLALLESGLIMDSGDPRINGFWKIFESDMKRFGYVEEVEEEPIG